MMNRFFSTLVCFLGLCAVAIAQDIIKPEATEIWEPEPRVITPVVMGKAPSDAIVLFDGKNADEWVAAKDGKAVGWKVEGNAITAVKGAGNIRTKREFGDVQLHIEFRTPAVVDGSGQGRGNSGIFLQSIYELSKLPLPCFFIINYITKSFLFVYNKCKGRDFGLNYRKSNFRIIVGKL